MNILFLILLFLSLFVGGFIVGEPAIGGISGAFLLLVGLGIYLKGRTHTGN